MKIFLDVFFGYMAIGIAITAAMLIYKKIKGEDFFSCVDWAEKCSIKEHIFLILVYVFGWSVLIVGELIDFINSFRTTEEFEVVEKRLILITIIIFIILFILFVWLGVGMFL